MSDDRRKDHGMRQRIDELQSGLSAQTTALAAQAKKNAADRKQLGELREKLEKHSGRLTTLMVVGTIALIVASAALVWFAFSLDDRADDARRLGNENRQLVNKLNAEIKRNQTQRQKSAANGCITRRIQNETLIRAFVPPEIARRASKKDRDILAGPADCDAYGRSVTTDEVPLPGPRKAAPKKGKK